MSKGEALGNRDNKLRRISGRDSTLIKVLFLNYQINAQVYNKKVVLLEKKNYREFFSEYVLRIFSRYINI